MYSHAPSLTDRIARECERFLMRLDDPENAHLLGEPALLDFKKRMALAAALSSSEEFELLLAQALAASKC